MLANCVKGGFHYAIAPNTKMGLGGGEAFCKWELTEDRGTHGLRVIIIIIINEIYIALNMVL